MRPLKHTWISLHVLHCRQKFSWDPWQVLELFYVASQLVLGPREKQIRGKPDSKKQTLNFNGQKVGLDVAFQKHLIYTICPALQADALQGSLARPAALLSPVTGGFGPSGEANPRKTGLGKIELWGDKKVGLHVAIQTHLTYLTRPSLQVDAHQGSLARTGALLSPVTGSFGPWAVKNQGKTGHGNLTLKFDFCLSLWCFGFGFLLLLEKQLPQLWKDPVFKIQTTRNLWFMSANLDLRWLIKLKGSKLRFIMHAWNVR